MPIGVLSSYDALFAYYQADSAFIILNIPQMSTYTHMNVVVPLHPEN